MHVSLQLSSATAVGLVNGGTGNVLWEYEAHIDANVARPCCGWAARAFVERTGVE